MGRTLATLRLPAIPLFNNNNLALVVAVAAAEVALSLPVASRVALSALRALSVSFTCGPGAKVVCAPLRRFRLSES